MRAQIVTFWSICTKHALLLAPLHIFRFHICCNRYRRTLRIYPSENCVIPWRGMLCILEGQAREFLLMEVLHPYMTKGKKDIAIGARFFSPCSGLKIPSLFFVSLRSLVFCFSDPRKFADRIFGGSLHPAEVDIFVPRGSFFVGWGHYLWILLFNTKWVAHQSVIGGLSTFVPLVVCEFFSCAFIRFTSLSRFPE